MNFLIETGLTRRIIEANSEEDAVVAFRGAVPRARLFTLHGEDFRIREATDEEVAEAFRSKKSGPMEGQLAMFGEAPASSKSTKSTKSKKEHA